MSLLRIQWASARQGWGVSRYSPGTCQPDALALGPVSQRLKGQLPALPPRGRRAAQGLSGSGGPLGKDFLPPRSLGLPRLPRGRPCCEQSACPPCGWNGRIF